MTPPASATPPQPIPSRASERRRTVITWTALGVYIALAAVLWGYVWIAFATAFLWFVAWAAGSPPEPPRTGRQADVASFMRSPLGIRLRERTCWVPATSRPWVLPVLAMLLVGPGIAIGLLTVPPRVHDPTSAQLVRHAVACAWVSPVVVLTVAWLAELLVFRAEPKSVARASHQCLIRGRGRLFLRRHVGRSA